MTRTHTEDQTNQTQGHADNAEETDEQLEARTCGCSWEYHMADCDIRDRRDWDAELEKSSYDPYYDDQRWEGER